MEPECGWGPGPVATILTSRVCPWQCVFCNENSYIPNMGRKPVDAVIDELNFLDRKYGVGSVVIHDSMFFQNPSWLREWIEKYPRKTKKLALLGRRPRRHRAPMARPVRGAAAGDQLEPDLHRLRVGQRPHPAAPQQGMHRRRQLLRHRPGEPHRRRDGRRGQGAAQVLVEHHAGHPRRDARGCLQDDAHAETDEAASSRPSRSTRPIPARRWASS